MNLNDWFQKGMSPEAYMESMSVNKENVQTVLNGFTIPAGEETVLKTIVDKNLKVIVLTEDWCGDAMVNVPVLLKVAEEANMEVSLLLRDQNLELMDQYLTNGTSRSIPIFIFINEEGQEVAVWGPRAPMVQQLVNEENAKLPPKDHELFEEKRKEMFGRLTSQYVGNEEIWEEVYESIKTTLLNQVLR
ncbi:thioredoxin family protein [Bacillus seohaeanensis]|jgi:hypothetical protein|uniref:Thioredoxin family protein n=1 Tax=Bacillus seohaeanensis TaxID=284580 RepID=A0ABW5RQD3_9BACI